MKVKFRNLNQTLELTQKAGTEKMFESKSKFDKGETSNSQKAYSSFKPAPIDTRESISQTTARLYMVFNRLIAKYKINTEQAEYFTQGKGHNRPYGKRDPIRKAVYQLLFRNGGFDKKGNYKK